MSEDDYISPTGKWPADAATLPKKLSALDGAIAKRVNADDGGEYFPTSPIIFVSQSHQFNWNSGDCFGPVTTRRGGRISVTAAPSFVDGSDNPVNRTRTLYWPIQPSFSNSPRSLDRFYSRALGATVIRTATGSTLNFQIPRRYMHHGATLAQATLRWRCGLKRANLPAVQSGIDLRRSDFTTAAAAGLLTTRPQRIGAASAAAYYNAGADQTVTYVCDQNNVIDTSAYHYFFQWDVESGANSFNNNNDQLIGLTLSYTAIPDAGTE